METEVSVVIPARNSAKFIDQTLTAIQNGSRQPAEILVIDGCSNDNTKAIAEEHNVTVFDNKKKHTSAGRRLGVEKAKGPVIAFTDADCIPASNWIEIITKYFSEDQQLAGVGGRVVLSNPRNDVQAYSAHVFESIKSFPTSPTQIRTKVVSGFSFAGANCAFSKQRILAVGSFRHQFANYAEEVDLLWRLVDDNAKCIFDPTLCVEHLGYADTIQGLLRTSFRQGVTSTLLTKYHRKSPRIDWALYAKWFKSCAAFLNPWNSDPWSALSMLQIGVFIAAKWYTSARMATINL